MKIIGKILISSVVLCFMLLSSNTKAQQYEISKKYWIFFTDKSGVTFDPFTYFDPKAIERRVSHNISLYDSTDFPVNEHYVSSVMQFADSLRQTSRWFNAVAVYAGNEALQQIRSLPFVSSVEPIQSNMVLASFAIETDEDPSPDYPLMYQQLERMGGSFFITNNITGRGVRVAVFDAGFPSVDTHEAFAHIRSNNRIIKTWDFVKNRENVYDYSSHGTGVLSCIAGIEEGKNVGLATESEFLLARTEMSVREPFSEEENWLAAAEWADQNGAQIINSSLGYTYHRYFREDMDGRSTLVSRAANMAASKGILVVNAAGNDGDNTWKYVGAPADADSVLSIGGIDPGEDPMTSIKYGSQPRIKIDFSSLGPTYDKRMKPNVCAFGKAYVAQETGYDYAYGTSFSSPLVAGFAACALQTNPNFTTMELFKAIEQSGDLYPYFDYAHGFGVPQARYFTENNSAERKARTFEFVLEDSYIAINISDFAMENVEGFSEYSYGNVLFYNIQNPDGTLHKYYVLAVNNKEVARINHDELVKGQRINVSYLGYFSSYLFE
ncbi:MAG: S8 family serine peptidase [Bacteroidales bacterium]|nr:S8 family serine peptidase [Bacteroidales bacterium]